MPIAAPDEAAIREQAYYLWEQEGRPDGRETEFWMRAVIVATEREQLVSLADAAPEKPVKPKAAAAKAVAAASKSKPAARAAGAKKPRK